MTEQAKCPVCTGIGKTEESGFAEYCSCEFGRLLQLSDGEASSPQPAAPGWNDTMPVGACIHGNPITPEPSCVLCFPAAAPITPAPPDEPEIPKSVLSGRVPHVHTMTPAGPIGCNICAVAPAESVTAARPQAPPLTYFRDVLEQVKDSLLYGGDDCDDGVHTIGPKGTLKPEAARPEAGASAIDFYFATWLPEWRQRNPDAKWLAGGDAINFAEAYAQQLLARCATTDNDLYRQWSDILTKAGIPTEAFDEDNEETYSLSLATRITQLAESLVKCKDQIEEERDYLDIAQPGITKLLTERDTAREQLAQREAEISQLRQERDNYDADRTFAKIAAEGLKAHVARLRAEIEDLTGQENTAAFNWELALDERDAAEARVSVLSEALRGIIADIQRSDGAGRIGSLDSVIQRIETALADASQAK